MNNQNKFLKDEQIFWKNIKAKEFQQFQYAKQSLILSIVIYFLIFIIEYYFAMISHSEVLKADAFNNLSGIVSNLLLLTGIHIASDKDEVYFIGFPVDDQQNLDNCKRIRLSRFRFETIFTLITSVIMIEIAIGIMIDGLKIIFKIKKQEISQPIGIVGATISIVLISIIYFINIYRGKKNGSSTLLAEAQDNLGDILTSIGTGLSIIMTFYFHLDWIGNITTILISIFILFSGVKIFLESSLNLVDYFNPQKENQYKRIILNDKRIKRVVALNAHYIGNLIWVEAEVIVNKKMTIEESFRLSETVERQLRDNYNIFDTKLIFYPG